MVYLTFLPTHPRLGTGRIESRLEPLNYQGDFGCVVGEFRAAALSPFGDVYLAETKSTGSCFIQNVNLGLRVLRGVGGRI